MDIQNNDENYATYLLIRMSKCMILMCHLFMRSFEFHAKYVTRNHLEANKYEISQEI